MNSPADIPGCVAWIEETGDEPTDMLEELGYPGTTFFHSGPPSILLRFDRELEPAEQAAVHAYLEERAKKE